MDGLIEPYLLKAINLLHSSAKDSGDQLKAMLDEAIRLKNETSSSSSGNKLPPPLTNILKNKDNKKKIETVIDEDVPLSKRRKESSPRSSQPSSPATSVTDKGKRKAETEEIVDLSSAKRFKDSPRSSQPSSPAGSSPRHSRSTSPNAGARRSDDMDSLNDADDLAQEILQDLTCVTCNGMEVSPGNQMVECQECHSLYHQECHRPTISDAEVNDPRSVFFCSDCKPLSSKSSGKPPGSSSSSSSSVGGTVSRPKSSSPIFFVKSRSDSPSSLVGKNTTTLVNGLKQATIKSSSGSNSGKPSGGSSSSSSSSSSSTSGSANTALISADKRLQNIKKRAATKLQEKRKPGGK